MLRSQLKSYGGTDPIWGFVALVGSERFTGEAVIGPAPRAHLYAADGRIYYAEREGDPPVGQRLLADGAITALQLEQGTVEVGGGQSLARLFHRQPLIDRDAVELTLESATESLLESIADLAVGEVQVFPLRHHPSGIHHWLRSAGATTLAVQPVPTPPVSPASAPHHQISAEVVDELPGPHLPGSASAATDGDPALDRAEETESAASTDTDGEAAAAYVGDSQVGEPSQPDADYDETPPAEAPPTDERTPDTDSHGEPDWSTAPMSEPDAQSVIDSGEQYRTADDTATTDTAPTDTAPTDTATGFDDATEAGQGVDPAEPPTSISASDGSLPLVARLAPLPDVDQTALSELTRPDDLPPLSSVTYLPAGLPAREDHSPFTARRPADLEAIGDGGGGEGFGGGGGEGGDTAVDIDIFAPSPAAAGTDLPKLAAAPIGIDQLINEQAAAATSDAVAQPNSLATVEIWEMVDNLTAGPAVAPTPTPTTDEPLARGWRRGNKHKAR